MKNFTIRLFIAISLLWAVDKVSAQCPDFDILFGLKGIVLNGQDKVDSFKIMYPNCDSMPGTILITDPQYSITDLNGLSNLGYAHQIWILSAPILSDLKGLELLEEVDILRINMCYKLDNLDLIAGLNINEILSIDFVDNLSSIVGMDRIDSLQQLVIKNTGLDSLSIDGLQNLTFVKELWLGGRLNGTGLGSLLRADKLEISDGFNDLSQVFDLIPNVSKSFELISISGPDTFDMVGIEGLESIDHLRLTYIQQLDLGGLESLDIPPIYQIEVNDCEDVLNLEAISNLKIEYGFQLENLGGITEIPSFNNYGGPQRLALRSLPELVDISSIESWENLERAAIFDNPNLAICHNRKLCELIADSSAIIRNNAPGCISLDEVREQCLTNVQAENFLEDVVVYPNPVREMIHLSSWDHESGSIRYRIYDVIGNTRMTGTFRGDHILLDGLASGYYILQLEKEGYVRSFTFVKE